MAFGRKKATFLFHLLNCCDSCVHSDMSATHLLHLSYRSGIWSGVSRNASSTLIHSQQECGHRGVVFSLYLHPCFEYFWGTRCQFMYLVQELLVQVWLKVMSNFDTLLNLMLIFCISMELVMSLNPSDSAAFCQFICWKKKLVTRICA